MKNQFEWINKTYNLNVKRGTRVAYTKPGHAGKVGRVTSVDRGYLRIRFDGDKKTYPAPFHPTWEISYGNH